MSQEGRLDVAPGLRTPGLEWEVIVTVSYVTFWEYLLWKGAVFPDSTKSILWYQSYILFTIIIISLKPYVYGLAFMLLMRENCNMALADIWTLNYGM